jgi:hypothetical protein
MKNPTRNVTPRRTRRSASAPAPRPSSAFLRGLALPACALLEVVLAGGCAATRITSKERLVVDSLPRPHDILVYDFAASAEDVPGDSSWARQFTVEPTSQTPEEIAAGRELGAQIAAELVEHIQAMGMPAQQAVRGIQPQLNDIMIRGYLISIHEGSAAKRVAIGFGSGASELRTAVEGFQMTPRGLRKIGSGTLESGGGKAPGAGLGAATLLATSNPAGLIVSSGVKVYEEASGRSTIEGRAKETAKEIADVLRRRFEAQGWIP